jgi:hypothetical protein
MRNTLRHMQVLPLLEHLRAKHKNEGVRLAAGGALEAVLAQVGTPVGALGAELAQEGLACWVQCWARLRKLLRWLLSAVPWHCTVAALCMGQ